MATHLVQHVPTVPPVNPLWQSVPTVAVTNERRQQMYPTHSTESGESLERKRKMVAAVVVAMANSADNFEQLSQMLADTFGSELEYIGSGASRRTYYLPYNLVLKYEYSHNFAGQNITEVKANKVMPEITCKVYGYYIHPDWDNDRDKVNIVIAERARPISRGGLQDKDPDYVPHAEYSKEEQLRWDNPAQQDPTFKRIKGMRDSHMGNIGKRFGGGWVMLDPGIVEGMDSVEL